MDALGIVFSELHDKNIVELTQSRTLASVPFGGRYRFIDFVLSNLVNAGVKRVGVITKSNYQSLMDHIGSGKAWDLSRKNGGIIVMPPQSTGQNGLYKTRFDALRGILPFIKSSKEEYVVLSDCDNVCNIDYEDVLSQHIESGADITVLYREKNIKDGKKRLLFDVDQSGRLNNVFFNTQARGMHNVYTNIMLLRRTFLVNLLEQSSVLGLDSISRDILVGSHKLYKIFGYKFKGFYASVDSLANYYRHNLELLDKERRDSLFNSDRPIYTKVRDSAPTNVAASAEVKNSLIADGCEIYGKVENSVLFRGVTVAKGAVVTNSILMQGTTIGADAKVNAVITDKNVTIKEKRVLSGAETHPYYIAKNEII